MDSTRAYLYNHNRAVAQIWNSNFFPIATNQWSEHKALVNPKVLQRRQKSYLNHYSANYFCCSETLRINYKWLKKNTLEKV
jgi:hypothetical protein